MEALFDMIARFNTEVREFIEKTMTEVGAAELGLDPRAGRVYMSDEGIAVHNGRKSVLEYYGGFEYISRECVETIGNYTFYLSDHDRVLECIQYYRELEIMKLDQVVTENDYMD
jgi:hypothetical protein